MHGPHIHIHSVSCDCSRAPEPARALIKQVCVALYIESLHAVLPGSLGALVTLECGGAGVCGNSRPEASASSPSTGTPRQRRTKPRAASSLGQSWPIGSYFLAGHTGPAIPALVST